MTDHLLHWANDPRTARLIRLLGLPQPVHLARAAGGYVEQPLAGRQVLAGGSPGGFALPAILPQLAQAGTTFLADPDGSSPDILVFDATGITTATDYRHLYDFFHPVVPRLATCGRVVVVAGLPEAQGSPVAAAAARGLEGFTRSLAKEIGKRGANANLLYLQHGAQHLLDEPLRFFCGPRCTFVDGQSLRITDQVPAPGAAPAQAHVQVLRGKVALVTGAARGIGAATAHRLAEEGAQVICLDVPADRDGLYETAARVGGLPFTADITDPATPHQLAGFLRQKVGTVDVVVHNAGITRDKTLGRMAPHHWDQVLAVNFGAIMALDAMLLAEPVATGSALLRAGGRILCLSSMGGIAGNRGQTNYAATKAALIGYVAAQAAPLARRGITINAVAPGFIETRMTAAMPLVPRELGRRLCSLGQGGQPRDVAELITFLASPGAIGVTGNTIRVCGQSLLGA